MYAVIKTGGKQYRVVEDQEIVIESLDKKPGEKVIFEQVLLVKKDDKVIVRPAELKGAKVEGVVIEHLRGEKIEGFKYKPKKRYRRRFGHRQDLTRVKIVGISVGSEKKEEKAKKVEKKAAVKKATPRTKETTKEVVKEKKVTIKSAEKASVKKSDKPEKTKPKQQKEKATKASKKSSTKKAK